MADNITMMMAAITFFGIATIALLFWYFFIKKQKEKKKEKEIREIIEKEL